MLRLKEISGPKISGSIVSVQRSLSFFFSFFFCFVFPFLSFTHSNSHLLISVMQFCCLIERQAHNVFRFHEWLLHLKLPKPLFYLLDEKLRCSSKRQISKLAHSQHSKQSGETALRTALISQGPENLCVFIIMKQVNKNVGTGQLQQKFVNAPLF